MGEQAVVVEVCNTFTYPFTSRATAGEFVAIPIEPPAVPSASIRLRKVVFLWRAGYEEVTPPKSRRVKAVPPLSAIFISPSVGAVNVDRVRN